MHSSPKASQRACSICYLLTLITTQQPWPLFSELNSLLEEMQSSGGNKQLSWQVQEWT